MNEQAKPTLGSLFDGIGGFPLAATIAGASPVWASEIDPMCVAVTRQQFPNMKHLGSITEINGADIPPVDIVTFGSPCQDLSVAGRRAGLDGEKSGLFHEAIRIIYEMREATNGNYPKYIVWENVPGAFSSHHGHDFQAVLQEITKTDVPMPRSGRWAAAGMVRGGGIGVAWRQLDAQHWGVPQRRKRIFLIGSFGNDSAGEILFKPDSVRRYLTPCDPPRQTSTSSTKQGADVQIYDARGNGDGRVAPTMTGDHNGHISDYATIVTYALQGSMIGRKDSNGPQGNGVNEDVSFTLNTIDRHAVVYALDFAAFNQDPNALYDFGVSESGINSTLVARGPSAVVYSGEASVPEADANSINPEDWVVRRLTPRECERLQGYPDNWTILPKIEDMTDSDYEFYARVLLRDKEIKGKPLKSTPSKASIIKWYNKLNCDSNRYRALGNSLAIPCALRVVGGIVDYMKGEGK